MCQTATGDARPVVLSPDELKIVTDRPADGHKGTFGTVLVIGGDVGMCGAAAFAARSAYRAGAGIVRVLTREENRVPLQILLPEAPLALYGSDTASLPAILNAELARTDAIALGCGIGQSDLAATIVAGVLADARTPLVIDADGLNLLAAHPEWKSLLAEKTTPVVLTPHMGEAARLLGLPLGDLLADDRSESAREIARTYHAVCVLKDARTIITDGTSFYSQEHGNQGMATGGSGDCLAGIIASLFAELRAKGNLPPAKIAGLGVLLHAMAGDRATAALGANAVMARDIADAVGDVLKEI